MANTAGHTTQIFDPIMKFTILLLLAIVALVSAQSLSPPRKPATQFTKVRPGDISIENVVNDES
jgi:hypothetical protein